MEPSASPLPHPPRVLVVDDHVGVRRLLAATLEAEDFEVDVAIDGLDALERVRESGLVYDAIVLDLEMPVMDGRTCFLEIRALAATPVLILAAANAHRVARELGAEDAMVKPFDVAVLAQRLTRLVESHRGTSTHVG